MARILVVDDEPGICRAFERFFKDAGHAVRTSSRAETALPLAKAFEPDVLLLDIRLPGMSGLDALKRFKEADPHLPVIVMTAYGTMDTAVEAMKRGAYDYVLKPLDLARISGVIARALEGKRIAADVVPGRAVAPAGVVATPEGLRGLVGRTAGMQEVFKKIGAVSSSEVPVLITGESGTGKEMVARAVHQASPRASGSFERVTCEGLSEEALSSEVFGVAPETTAVTAGRRVGRIESAAGGSLFFHEVAQMPAAVQIRLLRLLEEGTFEKVGGTEALPADVRILSCSGSDLAAVVAAGRFREDLYYRLNVMTIRVPPLRERLADIPVLAGLQLKVSGNVGGISREALRLLVTHGWPGNVRELRNALEHALVLARDGAVLPEHLPATVREGALRRPEEEGERIRSLMSEILSGETPEGEVYNFVMDRFEAPLIAEVLRLAGGNQVQAARTLGIHRTTLRSKIKKHGL
jgi:DNA-binding NtrC family response regulator